MKMKQMIYVGAAVAILLVPTMALAQGGCVDSPENPTALLALVGGLGGVVTMLRRRKQ
jgi:XrtJ-associated TM-motif-TM protein